MKDLLLKHILYNLLTSKKVLLKINIKSDIEYLHTFRVSVRRTISLLNIFFPHKKTIIKELKKIIKETNNLRELDVFLLTLNNKKYPNIRNKTIKLRDIKYKLIFSKQNKIKNLKQINKIVKKLKKIDCVYSNKKLYKLTIDSYNKSLKKYARLFSNNSEKHTNKILHQFRVKFKESRYALDVLLVNKRRKINKLKNIQDKLGKIQDIRNQISLLKKILDKRTYKEYKKLLKTKKRKLKKMKKSIKFF